MHRRTLLAGSAATVLSACGFRPRGAPEFAFRSLYLGAPQASPLARELQRAGIKADAIHGDKSQLDRIKALEAFKGGQTDALIATDVAARGLDVDDLPYVINYELPHTPEDYVHRIGRTGRAGKMGNAISLVSAHEVGYLVDIEKLIKRPIEQVEVAGFEPEHKIV